MNRDRMTRTLLPAVAALALGATALPAAAQVAAPASWRPLAERQDHVAQEIAAGVAGGQLSDLQARELRNQFQGLLNLEDDYRKTGLTPNQQADLQARYDTLEARIQVNSHPASIEVRRAPAAEAPEDGR